MTSRCRVTRDCDRLGTSEMARGILWAKPSWFSHQLLANATRTVEATCSHLRIQGSA